MTIVCSLLLKTNKVREGEEEEEKKDKKSCKEKVN